MDRLPAYPLFNKDPFFNFWLFGKELNSSSVKLWTGHEKTIEGTIEYNGKEYRFMGVGEGEKLVQTDVKLTSFTTEFTFSSDAFDLKVIFFSPLDPENIDAIALPLCYLSYEIKEKIPAKTLCVRFTIGEDVCSDVSTYRNRDCAVQGGKVPFKGYETAWMGLRRQNILSHADDSRTADWGYWYVAAKTATYEQTSQIEKGGKSRIVGSSDEKKDKFIFAFDETAAIYYFGEILKGYYYESGKTVFDAISEGYLHYQQLVKEAEEFDEKLMREADEYGEEYKLILKASLRQSVAAHKLCKDKNGEVLFLSKECHSNGCIATVDVSYPSMPLYLKYNPVLVKGMMLPILKFAKMPVWKYDFAPHDAGCYPYCCGQVYGLSDKSGNQLTFKRYFGASETYYPIWQLPAMDGIWEDSMQMPVEECSNLLIMAAAYNRYSKGDKEFLRTNFSLFEKWVKYLEKYGYCPDNQLCTDDFAGHLNKNVNLSIKASVGLMAFAEICGVLGKEELQNSYIQKAREHASKLEAELPCPMPLVFGEDDQFSLKYNIAFDVILNYGLYSEKLKGAEIERYLEKTNVYGVPLDSRKSYTKSDWIAWTTTLTKDVKKRKALLAPIAKYLKESKTAVPFGDWFDTITGDAICFQNRSVQGGMFITLLID